MRLVIYAIPDLWSYIVRAAAGATKAHHHHPTKQRQPPSSPGLIEYMSVFAKHPSGLGDYSTGAAAAADASSRASNTR